MKLELNRRDYLALLSVIEIADWVVNAYRSDELAETAPMRALEQKVLELAEQAGCGELVEYDAEEKRWWLTREFEETSDALQFVQEFENDNFWEQLSDRLIERDLKRALGAAAYKRLDPEELEEKEEPYRTLYSEEFLTHGVERLEILQHQPGAAGGSKTRLS
jgi:predicted ATP-dependent endonuclease of OLD family